MQVVKSDSSTPNTTNYGGLKKYNDTTNLPKSNTPVYKKSLSGSKGHKVNNQSNLIKLPNYNVNKTDLSLDDVTALLKSALDTIEDIEENAGYKVNGSSALELNEKLKEAENKLIKSQDKFNLFKYYSFVWLFSIVLLCFFVLMFIGGAFNAYTSTVGVLAAIVGMVGAYLDWKDKEKGL